MTIRNWKNTLLSIYSRSNETIQYQRFFSMTLKIIFLLSEDSIVNYSKYKQIKRSPKMLPKYCLIHLLDISSLFTEHNRKHKYIELREDYVPQHTNLHVSTIKVMISETKNYINRSILLIFEPKLNN